MTEGNNPFNQTGDLPADAVKLLELAGQWLEANPRDVQARAKARDMVARLAEIATTPPALQRLPHPPRQPSRLHARGYRPGVQAQRRRRAPVPLLSHQLVQQPA